MLVVTTEQVPGRTIDTVIGEVVGLTPRTRNPFTEGVRRVDGHAATEMVPTLLQWRKDAIAHMVEEAAAIGADAVIAMKFDSRIISATWLEICAYGTAVRLVPLADECQPLGERGVLYGERGVLYGERGVLYGEARPGR